MQTFATAREAKDFIVGRIVTEAQREGVSLSEVERKMLYFSETGWTLPDIGEVNDAFDREYNQAEYEQKMAALIGKAWANARKSDREEFNAWKEAVRSLRQEDHYLLVLLDGAGASESLPWRVLKLSATALIVACLILAIVFFTAR